MRVLLRYDVPMWAFARRAWVWEKHAPRGWEVVSCSNGSVNNLPEQHWGAIVLLDCSAGVPHYAGEKPKIIRLIASHAWLYEKEDKSDWRTRGVNANRNWGSAQGIVASSDTIAVYNEEQARQFRLVHPDVRVVPYFVDTSIWYRDSSSSGDKLRVGWCYQVSGGRKSFKGMADVLIPLIAKVGDRVEWRVEHPEASSAMGAEDLRAWYSSCDVFLCTSSGEGGPQPVMEAAACGCVPLVTDVGQLSDWHDIRAMNLVVPTYRNASEAARTVQVMADKLLWMASNRSETDRLRQRVQGSVMQNYDAKRHAPLQLEQLVT